MYPTNRAVTLPIQGTTIKEHMPRWQRCPPAISGGGCAHIVLLVFVFQDRGWSFSISNFRFTIPIPSLPRAKQLPLHSSLPCHTISRQPETPYGHVPQEYWYYDMLDHAWHMHLPLQ